MGIGIGTALIASAIIGAGSAMYSGQQQKKAAEADAERRRQEAAAAKAEADRIAAETKPEEEALGAITFGVNEDDDSKSGVQQFIVPKTSALGVSANTKGRSGLGFAV